MWQCKKCETINEDEFCAICGEPKLPHEEPIYANKNIEKPESEYRGVATGIPRRIVSSTPPPSKEDSGNKLLVGVLLGVIIALTALLVVFAVYAVSSRDDSNNEKEIVYVTESPEVTQKPTDAPDEKRERPVPGESSEVMHQSVTSRPVPETTSRPRSDGFVYGMPYSSFDLNPTYTRIYNDDYHWYCAIPDNFVQTKFGVNPEFEAEDGTAKLKIESKSNDYNKTLQEVRTEYLNSMNGVDVLKQSGKDWFAASFVVDGIAYYKKCYVDHYIRSFEISFPEEYLHMGVYNDYIEYIEDNFRRTDV